MIFQHKKLADWNHVEKLSSSFFSYWKETLKIFSNPKSKVCRKMLFSSCKVQQSRSTESKQNFLCLIFLSAISPSLVLFSVLKDGGTIQGQKLWSIIWPYLKRFPKPHKHNGGCWSLSRGAGVNSQLSGWPVPNISPQWQLRVADTRQSENPARIKNVVTVTIEIFSTCISLR